MLVTEMGALVQQQWASCSSSSCVFFTQEALYKQGLPYYSLNERVHPSVHGAL